MVHILRIILTAMAAFELLPPSLSDEQRRHDETMVLDTNQQQVSESLQVTY